MGWWQKLSDALPWNQRRIQQTHAERERELLELPYEPPPPAASAAEAMAEMRAAAKAGSAPRPAVKAEPEAASTRKLETGSERAGNAALKEFARKKGV